MPLRSRMADARMNRMEESTALAAVAGSVPDSEFATPLGVRREDGPMDPRLLAAGQRFAAFAAHHGEACCGPPLGAVTWDGDVAVQYFRNVVLELGPEGQVRPRPLGALALDATQIGGTREGAAPPVWSDLRGLLPSHPTLRYPQRPLSQIRHLVLHHSGVSARHDARQIAEDHVRANGWPGIGYHFVIDDAGLIALCQDLSVSSHHVAQFNPVSVGIALLGDLRVAPPGPRQLDAAADLLAWLLGDLGLPRQAIRGHGEMVSTDCPGPHFLGRWKAPLLDKVGVRLAASVSMPAAPGEG